MLSPFLRKNPLFVNIFLNDYIKNSEYKYMENIHKNIENLNANKKRKDIICQEEPKSLIVIPSVFFLSLTAIIHYFYSMTR
jgi:hypothetical protein